MTAEIGGGSGVRRDVWFALTFERGSAHPNENVMENSENAPGAKDATVYKKWNLLKQLSKTAVPASHICVEVINDSTDAELTKLPEILPVDE